MILKNGKRIDGCTDTLPVGTVQPFLGLTPPLGYLVCQGQLISKVEYPELYNICKSTFGTETETHFYLPDLRGKTIAGYHSGDDTFNILGLSLGEKTHLLTELESGVREHTHAMPLAQSAGVQDMTDVAYRATRGGAIDPEFRTGRVTGIHKTNPSDYAAPYLSGQRDANAINAHNNIQPTMVLNWIVKAVMLIPEYFKVDNTLTSTSTSNALSAAQGKILNDSKLSLSGGVLTGRTNIEFSGVSGATEVPIWSKAHLIIGATVTNGVVTRCPSLGFVEYQNSDGVLYMKDRALFWASSNNNMGHIPAANTGYEIVHNGNKYDTIGINWTNGKEVRTLDSIDGKPIYKKYVEGNFNGTTNVTLATNVDKYLDAQMTVLRADASQWHRANAHIMPNLGSAEEPSHIDGIFQQGSTIKTYCTNTVFTTAAFRGFIYYTKL